MAPLSLLALCLLLLEQAYGSSTSPRVLHMPLKGRKHFKHAAGNVRRGAYETTLQNYWAAFEFFVTLGVGTPPQIVELAVATTVSDTWVFEKGSCQPAGDEVACYGGEFHSSDSDTYQSKGELGLFRAVYDDGSKANGPYFSDQVTIAGATMKHVVLGLASRALNINYGALGLGFPTDEGSVQSVNKQYPNFPVQLKLNNLTASSSYSIYLNTIGANTGAIVLGGYDTEKFDGKLTMFPVQNTPYGTKDFFIIPMTQFGAVIDGTTQVISSKLAPYPIPIQLSTGTTLSYIPYELFYPFVDYLGLFPHSDPTPTDPWYVRCDAAKDHASESAAFSFGSAEGGTTILVPIPELIFPLYNYDGEHDTINYYPSSGGTEVIPGCYFGLRPMGPGESPLLGQSFLRSAYALFNLENPSVGLAQAKLNVAKSNLVEYVGLGYDKEVTTDTLAPTASTVDYFAATYTSDISAKTKYQIQTLNSATSVPYTTTPIRATVPTTLSTGAGATPTPTGSQQPQPGGSQNPSDDSSSGSSDLGVKVGVPVAIVVVLIIAAVIFFIFWRKRRQRKNAQTISPEHGAGDGANEYKQGFAYDEANQGLKTPMTQSHSAVQSPLVGNYATELPPDEKSNLDTSEMSYRSGVVSDTYSPVELGTTRETAELSTHPSTSTKGVRGSSRGGVPLSAGAAELDASELSTSPTSGRAELPEQGSRSP